MCCRKDGERRPRGHFRSSAAARGRGDGAQRPSGGPLALAVTQSQRARPASPGCLTQESIQGNPRPPASVLPGPHYPPRQEVSVIMERGPLRTPLLTPHTGFKTRGFSTQQSATWISLPICLPPT